MIQLVLGESDRWYLNHRNMIVTRQPWQLDVFEDREVLSPCLTGWNLGYKLLEVSFRFVLSAFEAEMSNGSAWRSFCLKHDGPRLWKEVKYILQLDRHQNLWTLQTLSSIINLRIMGDQLYIIRRSFSHVWNQLVNFFCKELSLSKCIVELQNHQVRLSLTLEVQHCLPRESPNRGNNSVFYHHSMPSPSSHRRTRGRSSNQWRSYEGNQQEEFCRKKAKCCTESND